MKKSRIISAFLTLVMALGPMTVGVDAAWEDKVDDNGDPIIDYLTKEYKTPEDKLADMVLLREGFGYELWYEEFTGEVALRDTATGQVLFTNPYDLGTATVPGGGSPSNSVKQSLLSQLQIKYLDNDQEKTMDSYVEAALRGQIIQKNIKNGIRVEYAIGEEQTTRLVPRLIEKSRFETLILDNITDEFWKGKVNSFYEVKDPYDPTLTERQLTEMLSQFPITEEMAVRVCDPNITAKELRTVEDLIKQYCPNYTYEELEYDHSLTNYTGDDAAPPRFRMALEYTLNETGMDVRLPANGISFDETAYQFQTVAMLPYFGAGNNDSTGYTFIPDGSGALVRFEDIKGRSYNIGNNIYGEDYAYHEIAGQHSEVMRWPVYGIVTNFNKEVTPDETEADTSGSDSTSSPSDTETEEGTGEETTGTEEETTTEPQGVFYDNGFLAVITEGDSLARLMDTHGGNTHPYNAVYAQFTPRPSDKYNLADSISVSGNATWTVTSKRKYTGSYRIKYIMLRDKEICEEKGIDDYYPADYIGMATAYRDYLTQTGVLSKLENTKEDIPLYVESFGTIETTERVASFPVTVDTPLTTFENIKTMHDELVSLGVPNVNFKLTGFANGGMEPTMPYRLKWVKAVGGDDGFQDLVEYAAANDFDIFPDFNFVYMQHEDTFDGFSMSKHAIKTIDDRYTSRRAYDAATQSFDRSFQIAVSPIFYDYFYDTFGPNYAAYGNDSIAVSSLGTDLNSDFDEDDPYHREDNKLYTVELLSRISEDVPNVMVEGGNAYALQYADVITDMSLSSSRFVNASESVPFIGMVLHGSKVFTGTATNMEGDINEAILRAIENGATMNFILSYQNTSKLKEDMNMSSYYSVAYDIWKDDIAKYYSTLNDATRDLQTSYIVDHEFLKEAERIPDEDELEADRIAAELAAATDTESAQAKEESQARAERLAERLARQNGTYVEPEDEGTDVGDETADDAALDEGAADAENEADTAGDAAAAEGTDQEDADANLDENGEEIVEEEEEKGDVPEKYATTSGSVVRVEYENGVNFILNYNSYDITVDYNGTNYTIGALSFVRID